MRRDFIKKRIKTVSIWTVAIVIQLGLSTGIEASYENEIIAGDSISGYSGDGGSATAAKLANPYAVARDSIGNLYIVDNTNNAIRKVDTNGIISTLISGLNNPQGVCVDASDNIYVADQGNLQVGFYNATAHTYNASFISGIFAQTIGIDQSNKLYIGANFPARVDKYNADGSINVANLITGASNPKAICVDSSGNVYVADPHGGSGGTIGRYDFLSSTYDSNFIIGLNNPYGVCVDVQDNIYISEANSGSISMVHAGSKTLISLISGLNRPQGLCADEDMNLYVTEGNANVVRKFSFPFLTVDFTNGAELSAPVTGSIKFVGASDSDVCTFDGSATNDVWVNKGKMSISSSAPIMSGRFVHLDGGDVIVTEGFVLPPVAMDQDGILDVHTTDSVSLNEIAGPGILSIESDRNNVVDVTSDLSSNTAGGINMNHGEMHVNGGKTPVAPLKIANGVQLRLTSGQVSKALTVDAGGTVVVDAGKKVGDVLSQTLTYDFDVNDGYFKSGSNVLAWPSGLTGFDNGTAVAGETNGPFSIWFTTDTSDQHRNYGGVNLTFFNPGGFAFGWTRYIYYNSDATMNSAHPTIVIPTDNDVALVGDVLMQSGSSVDLGAGATWAHDVTVTSVS